MISLFGFDARRPPPGRFQLVDGIPHFLSTHAAQLVAGLASSFELVWCSGWEEKADEILPGVLGVPKGLAHLTFPGIDETPLRHWKLASIEAFAGADRPAAWIDDAFDDSCHAWAAQRAGPTKLVRTEPAVGLTAAHTADLAAWAARLLGSWPAPHKGRSAMTARTPTTGAKHAAPSAEAKGAGDSPGPSCPCRARHPQQPR